MSEKGGARHAAQRDVRPPPRSRRSTATRDGAERASAPGPDRAAGDADAPRPPPGTGDAPAPAPVSTASLDRVALVVRAQGNPRSLDLCLAPDLYVRLSCAHGAVDVLLDAQGTHARWAASELPRIVAALRNRGVEVRGAALRSARRAGPAALTAPRGSATTAPTSARGTVAKW